MGTTQMHTSCYTMALCEFQIQLPQLCTSVCLIAWLKAWASSDTLDITCYCHTLC